MPYRVVQWSTGNVGRQALRAIIRHPDLELVGVWVHSPEKAGRDAGELCGDPRTGITTTNDAESLLALKPDCVSYTATADLRPAEAVDDMCRMLAAGINVVATSVVPLVYPPAADPTSVERLETACRAGGASCFTSGIDPGFANDTLPLVLTGLCARIDAIRVSEIVNYDTYDQAEVLFGTMGFGHPLDHTPLLLIPGVLTMAWGPVVRQIAAGLGAEVERVREFHERRATDTAFDIPSGHVAAGTTAAMRFEVAAIVNGRPVVVVEHVTRLRDDLAPEWPQPTGSGCYRVEIEGSPRVRCELTLGDAAGDHNSAALIATALRILNAIPAVCAAAPGLLSALDLPLVTARGALR